MCTTLLNVGQRAGCTMYGWVDEWNSYLGISYSQSVCCIGTSNTVHRTPYTVHCTAMDGNRFIFEHISYTNTFKYTILHTHHERAHDIAIEYKYHGIMMMMTGIQAIYKYFLTLLFLIIIPSSARRCHSKTKSKAKLKSNQTNRRVCIYTIHIPYKIARKSTII